VYYRVYYDTAISLKAAGVTRPAEHARVDEAHHFTRTQDISAKATTTNGMMMIMMMMMMMIIYSYA